ncbi:MAG: M23 family metallopeptidase [Reyranella sp.]|uniref:M23 family metallopeptidase n=1 Tax=Reyranella sp. TaxID=1929291 RepID=UPI00121D4213|nr:M23 family metallopeptidase [Reyranella sp.]TAJ98106.1 MAG: M23 family metallopeptidase [Reyranella sp.]TBR22241.1 MAG: M23 family metallopeptidase [Reyranella sp.]
MKNALRFPSRWAGRMHTLGTMAVLSVALGACNTVMGAREGTMEYPGSAAGPNAVPVYVVKDKDTVDALSRRYGVPSQTIIDRNNLKAPYTLKPGQTLAMPGARFVQDSYGEATSQQTAAANPNAPSSVKREGLPPPPGTSQGEAPRSAAPAGEPTPLSKASQSVTVPATPPRMIWPVHGKVVSGYGTSGGQKNDGIDIAAAKGTPVKAADGGRVVYAGGEVARMGNLLLIEHPGGYITAYGNNESLAVKKGDVVKKGQTIAKVGNSGGTAEPQLHFEVRRGGKTVDPTTVLGPQ